MDSETSAYFGILDYGIFAGMLLISAIIGVYFAFFAKTKQNTTKEYLMGGKTLGIFPVSMSLVASNISGIAMMGLPSEVYTFGTQLAIVLLAEITAYTFGSFTFLPVIYNLGLTSSYEYLELRFNTTLRKLGSAFFLIGNMLYVPIVIYVPALAFSQISDISLNILIPLVCIVCTFYTTLGGLKAVVWTDTFQTMMIFFGLVTVASIGTYQIGGVGEVWKRNDAADRIEFFNMSLDVTIRHTFWSVLIGKFFGNLSICSVNQSMVQRYVAMPTLKKARFTIYILSFSTFVLMSFCFYTGLVAFAAFWDCDPVTLRLVKKPDSIVPYFVMKFTRHIPGLPGIFMAGVFSAALSSLSTCQNSMCGVIYEDFIKPKLKKPLSEARASFFMKIMVVIIGIATMLLASVVDQLGGVIQTTSSFSAMTLGPLLGIYILGMSCPWANSKGALVGGIAGSAVVGWISLGAQWAIRNRQIVYPWKPLSTSGCSNATLAAFALRNLTSEITDPVLEEPFYLFRLTYVYYTPLGVIVSIVVGVLVSWATGFQDPLDLNPNLLFSFIGKPFKEMYEARQKKLQNVKVIDEKKTLLEH